MHIQLEATRSIKILFEENSTKEDTFSLAFSNGFTDEDLKSFYVRFEIQLSSSEGFALDIIHQAKFQTDEDITEEFKESHFPKINAPAIAYPYVRSFVSFLTLNAGYEAVVLPTVNFAHIVRAQEEEEKRLASAGEGVSSE